MTYEGVPGYPPMLAVWAETMVVVADEFRDGNVSAMREPLPAVKAAFAALPEMANEFYFRGDSACHEHRLLDWLRDEQRQGGPQASSVSPSARMSKALTLAVRAAPDSDWKPYGKEDAEAIRECAEVMFCPAERSERKRIQPLRYVAVRIRKRQAELFADGSAVKHFAVLSNFWQWEPARLLEWHREKAGTIEAMHNILKNDLAAGTLPAKRFGANAGVPTDRSSSVGWNAAWLRLAVLTHNLLTALKRLALPTG